MEISGSLEYLLRLMLMVASLAGFVSRGAGADSAPWEFSPPHAGRAIVGGGWMESLQLGAVNGSPEFSFPLQLIYLNDRTERGLFGSQWFCPQLESSVLPKQKGVLLWRMPDAGLLPLFVDKSDPTIFAAQNGVWKAKTSGLTVSIGNTDGWRYIYKAGRIEAIVSPTERELDFTYAGRALSQVILRDTGTGAARVVIAAGAQADDKLIAMNVCGVNLSLIYYKGSDGRLSSIQRAGSEAPTTFAYNGRGVLAGEQPPSGPGIVFNTEEVMKGDGGKVTDEASPVMLTNLLPETRLIEDDHYQYTYKNLAWGVLSGASVALKDKAGATQSLDFSAKRGVLASTDASGQASTSYYYLAPGQKYDGKLRQVEKNGVIVASYRYSRVTGNLIERKDKDGLLTFFEYPDTPKGFESRAQYSKPIRIYQGTRKTSKLVAALQYDSAGNLKQITDGNGKITRYIYDGRGQLVGVIDPAGTRTAINYDAFGRRIGVSQDNKAKESAGYDENGRIKTQRTPDGQTLEYGYDDAGRVQAVRQNGVLVSQFKYDGNGGVIAETDALGRTTNFDRDPAGHLLAVHQPNGSITKYEYDETGHRIAQVDGDGNRITFGYDGPGHLVRQTNPLGQKLTWAFDANGHLSQRTNGVQTIRYHYDSAGRVLLLDYGKIGEKLKYAYDAKGREKKVSSPTNSLTFFYDADGRVAAEQFIRGQTSDRVIRYAYDASGKKISVVLSERETSKIPAKNEPPAYRLIQQTEYAYESDGHLTEIKSNGMTACTYRYDALGRLASRIYGDGISGTYAYDAFGRQTRLDLSGGPLITPLSLVYAWDAAGQLLSRRWNGETQVYGYDSSGQLLSVASPAPDSRAAAGSQTSAYQQASNPPSAAANILETYRYDPAGNMLEKYEEGARTVMTYDAANQLKTATVGTAQTTFTYDAAGRLVSELGPDTKSREYGFLDKVLVLTKLGGVRIGYDYYPDGQLAAKGPLQSGAPSGAGTLGQNAGAFIACQPSALKETDPDLAESDTQKAMGITEEFLWDDLAILYRDGETYAIEPRPSGGIPIASTRDPQSDTKTYFINDVLGTTLAVVHPDRINIVPLSAFGQPRSAAVSSDPKAQQQKLSMENDSP